MAETIFMECLQCSCADLVNHVYLYILTCVSPRDTCAAGQDCYVSNDIMIFQAQVRARPGPRLYV